MLLGLRILRYLGAKRIVLVGVDFKMQAGSSGYSFGQNRTEEAAKSNNEHFVVVNKWLTTMVENGAFKEAGLEVYNCYQCSGLRAFEYVPFEEAVKAARGIIETTPDLAGWYEK
jgi:hypothetical protein